MKIYVISDTHLGHDKLVELSGRPADFSDKILLNLERTSGDLLIHCGDFCIGQDEQNHKLFMNATSGFKKRVLVRGNHDKKSDTWYLNHGWDMVCEIFWGNYFGKQIIFSHMPIMKKNVGTFSPHFPPDINVHGHLHGCNDRHGYCTELYDKKWFYDVAPDTNKYAPVSLIEIIKEINYENKLNI